MYDVLSVRHPVRLLGGVPVGRVLRHSSALLCRYRYLQRKARALGLRAIL